ncbi:MAG: peptidase [Bacteriovoracaceae bacterium]|nr:peptidase [Bacteriovoracaceae bacterium]
MVGCPYCGEKVALEARICRHCNRHILYSVIHNSILDEKQTHQFFKSWNAIDKKSFRHLSLLNYSQSKAELAKTPLTLAWDLSFLDAERFSKSLTDFKVETKLQGGMPSNMSFIEEKPVTKNHIQFVYLMLLLITMTVGIAFWSKKKQEEPTATDENIRQALHEITESDSARNNNAVQPNSELNRQAIQNEKTFDRNEMEHILNASVFIRDSNSLGSGFLITADGYLLTNSHVTSQMAEPIVILRDGRQFKAEKIREDKHLDAALLKIPIAAGEFLNLGNANELFPGQPVITIGNPGGLSFTVTRGIVSYVGRVISGVPYIQTDAAINRGNSGGPMINQKLEVVGINSMTSLGEQGISFALPINLVCSNSGIAVGISTTPSSCDSLLVSPDTITPATLERQKPEAKNPSALTSLYQSEIDSLKSQLDKDEKDLVADTDRLNSEMKDLQDQANANASNNSIRESIQHQFEEAKKNLDAIPFKRAESQLRYIRQAISVLERQKADPDFASSNSQIEGQISGLATKQKSLEAALNTRTLQ